jgi:hypothetical protein
MKKILTYLMSILLFAGIMTACDDDDTDMDPPTIAGATISGDNSEITVSFNMGVYASENGTGNLTEESFVLEIEGGNATVESYTVEHTAGQTVAVITVTYNGIFTGEEVLTITGAVFNADGIPMEATQSATVDLVNLGIIGAWYSSGDNVAVLLSAYFNVDSIYAMFNADQTYVVESYDTDGVMTEYLGTYTQETSEVNGIWTIVLNQSSPSSLTSEGIFGFFLDETTFDMKYEVVQTEPDLGNAPPTPEGGFGSSNGGQLGDANVQNYLKID